MLFQQAETERLSLHHHHKATLKVPLIRNICPRFLRPHNSSHKSALVSMTTCPMPSLNVVCCPRGLGDDATPLPPRVEMSPLSYSNDQNRWNFHIEFHIDVFFWGGGQQDMLGAKSWAFFFCVKKCIKIILILFFFINIKQQSYHEKK